MKGRERVILLGHRGLVGSALSTYLRGQGVDVLRVDRANYDSHRGAEADILINANGSSDKRLAETDPIASLRANVETVMRSLSDFHCSRYVLISSVDVYEDLGDPGRNAESVAIDGSRLSGYGLIKYVAELVARRMAARWLVLRLGPVVGPGLRKNPIFDLLSARTLFVSPESRLSFIDTRDVARITWELRGDGGEIYNVAGMGTVRLADVAADLGVDLSLAPGSLPVHRYDVNVAKLRARTMVRSSQETISNFLREHDRRAPGQ